MTCYHPLSAFDTGLLTDKGKTKYLIRPCGVMKTGFKGRLLTHPIFVPCGKCIGCRLDYASEWSKRLMLEKSLYPDELCHFITLTYDDDHMDSISLDKSHITKFMKDLRRYYEYHYDIDNIRFFACGEYGSQSARRHIHMILFNLPIEDKRPIYSNPGLFTSDIIQGIWKRGLISIGDVTLKSCGYVAQYIVKKRKGKDSADYYKKLGIIPEFVVMSRRPGIGANAFSLEWYDYHELFLNGTRFKPGKFYDNIFEKNYGSLDCFRDLRKKNELIDLEKKLHNSSFDLFTQLEIEEDEKIAKTNILKKRELC